MAKKAAPLSPLAPTGGFPRIPAIGGVTLAAGAAGVRYRDRPDVVLGVLPEGTTVAGVLTRSKSASAPVQWCRHNLEGGHARALVVNAGNANAFTGAVGERSVKRTAEAAAALLGVSPGEVFIASTGVIGEPLPEQRIIDVLPALKGGLKPEGFEAAARAIMTTDTFAKGASRRVRIGNATVTIAGFCKGAGMIAPNMGTLLTFLFTDARLPADVLQACLVRAANKSFNCISIDGDTSTSDTCLLFATGAVGAAQPAIEGLDDPNLIEFRRGLNKVCRELAQLVVRDGEGASKFVTIRVNGATCKKSARKLGLSVAGSPLVKTAVAGQDPNWGRIVAALGKAGEPMDQNLLRIWIGGLPVAENGARHPAYDEAALARHMKGQEIEIEIELGLGSGACTVWTCDLTHGYIDVNADYRS